METKAILDFMTVLITNIPDQTHRKQLDFALAKTRAMIEKDQDAIEKLDPPYIPKHIS